MDNDIRRILILGASGRFGMAATRAFAQAGYQVLAQSRAGLLLPPVGVRELRMGPGDPALLREAAGVRAVVNAVSPAYDQWTTQAVPLALQAIDLAAALRAPLMLPGNVYNFGEQMPEVLREDTPQRPTNAKGRIRCEIEARMRERAPAGMGSIVIRAGDFFGSGTGSWLDLAIIKSLSAGKLVYPGPLNLPHAWAYLPDLARAFVAVADLPPEPLHRCLHFPGHTLTGSELLDALETVARSMGLVGAKPCSRGSMPWALIRAGGLVVPMWRMIAEMSYLWRVPHRLDGAALQAAVGALPSTPLQEALTESLLSLGLAQRRAA